MFGEPWIGVDLDGTLAHHTSGWSDWLTVGEPVPAMVTRVRQWLAEGKRVRILTARVARGIPQRTEIEAAIRTWCFEHLGEALEVTSEKDPQMIELWDDRAVCVEMNTGRFSRFIDGALQDPY